MPPFVRRSIDLPDRQGAVAVLDFGDPDRPVDLIFSHANGFNALTYRRILAPLAGEMRIIAYDLRGHGRTSLPPEPLERPDWTDLRDDLGALMDALNIDRPVTLGGHSFGATVSLTTASAAPARVRSLALFDPVLFPRRPNANEVSTRLSDQTLRRRSIFPDRAAATANWRGRGAFATWPDDMLEDYAADGLIETADGVQLACSPAWEASSYRAQGQDGVALLLTSNHPTTVLKAQSHSTCEISPDDPRLAANRAVTLMEIAGTSHFLPMERPDLATETLRVAAP